MGALLCLFRVYQNNKVTTTDRQICMIEKQTTKKKKILPFVRTSTSPVSCRSCTFNLKKKTPSDQVAINVSNPNSKCTFEESPKNSHTGNSMQAYKW